MEENVNSDIIEVETLPPASNLAVQSSNDISKDDSTNSRKNHRNSGNSGANSSHMTRSKDSPTSFPKTKGSIIKMASSSSSTLKRFLEHETSVTPNTSVQESEIIHTPPVKRQKLDKSGEKLGAVCDPYCWVCHKEGSVLDCAVCPRSYHARCTGQGPVQDPTCWMCPECQCIMVAEDIDTQSPAMSVLSVDQLVTLFKFSLQRLKGHALEAFQKPVCPEQVPTYLEYVVHPMDLQTLEKNIKLKMYGCTESLLADAKWIYHNSVVFNGNAHKLTSSAKSLLTACKQEMREIEVCPDCYLHAYTLKDNWFVEPCRRPHALVWAKLKGFPFWPGKAMRVVNGNVDIRFFGAHDRAWVPENLCYQLSTEMPAPIKTKKKTSFENSLDELEQHISKLRLKLGGFEYAPVRTPFDPEKLYLSPISKVTGRRHSDAEQSSPAKGRTVTIVTSSWMRKIQAEGATAASAGTAKTSPSKKKRTPKQSRTPKKESRMMQGSKAPETPAVVKHKVEFEPSFKATETNKNPPLGVFEISNNLDMPKELNIQTQTLILNDFSASHLEKLKKIESTIERIRESFNDEEEEEGPSRGTDASDVQTLPDGVEKAPETPVAENTDSDDTPLSQLQSEICGVREADNSSPICEVTSTTNVESIKVNASPSFSNQQFDSPKKESAFVMKLHQTIQSCKANLGLKNVAGSDEKVPGLSDSEAESEASKKSVEEKDKHDSPVEMEITENGAEDGSVVVEDSTEPMQVTQASAVSESDEEKRDEERVAADVIQSSEKEYESDSDIEVIAVNNKKSPEVLESDNLEKENISDSSRSNNVPIATHEEDSRCSTATSNSETEAPTSHATPVSVTTPDITKYAYKVIEIMTDLCKNVGTPESYAKGLEMEMGRIKWLHEQEIKEIKHNTDLVLMEVRECMEADKKKAIAELKRKHEVEKSKLLAEKDKAIAETKKKQWCAHCSNPAIYYCCWNTSYCDYKCQQEHWPSHMSVCAQAQRTTMVSDSQTDNARPKSNVVIAHVQAPAGRPRPRANQNCVVGGDVRNAYESHHYPVPHTLPLPMLNPPHPSRMQCLPPSRTAQVIPQTGIPQSGAQIGNNTVSVHYVSSLPSGISNYQIIPTNQNIPLPRITVPRLPQVSPTPSVVQPRLSLTRPTSVLVSRPSFLSPAGQPRFPPSPHS